MSDREKQRAILEEVLQERDSQDRVWGTQHHTALEWIPILGEEFGEVCKAAGESHHGYGESEWSDYRLDLVQVAAVAVAMIESYDRGEAVSFSMQSGLAKANAELRSANLAKDGVCEDLKRIVEKAVSKRDEATEELNQLRIKCTELEESLTAERAGIARREAHIFNQRKVK
jgi:hypothetical protein